MLRQFYKYNRCSVKILIPTHRQSNHLILDSGSHKPSVMIAAKLQQVKCGHLLAILFFSYL
jgi:hypothetical protein